MVTGNVRLLESNLDKRGTLMRTQWLQGHIWDSDFLHGSETTQTDGDCRQSRKSKGGGIAKLVNNRWCKPVHV